MGMSRRDFGKLLILSLGAGALAAVHPKHVMGTPADDTLMDQIWTEVGINKQESLDNIVLAIREVVDKSPTYTGPDINSTNSVDTIKALSDYFLKFNIYFDADYSPPKTITLPNGETYEVDPGEYTGVTFFFGKDPHWLKDGVILSGIKSTQRFDKDTSAFAYTFRDMFVLDRTAISKRIERHLNLRDSAESRRKYVNRWQDSQHQVAYDELAEAFFGMISTVYRDNTYSQMLKNALKRVEIHEQGHLAVNRLRRNQQLSATRMPGELDLEEIACYGLVLTAEAGINPLASLLMPVEIILQANLNLDKDCLDYYPELLQRVAEVTPNLTVELPYGIVHVPDLTVLNPQRVGKVLMGNIFTE
jgi:hypothetical protein